MINLQNMNTAVQPQLLYLVNVVPLYELNDNAFILQSLHQQQPVLSELEQLQQQFELQEMSQQSFAEEAMPELQNLKEETNNFQQMTKGFQKVDTWLHDKLYQFEEKYKNVLGAIMILAGAFFCLFGRALLGYAVFLAATGTGFIGGLFLTFKAIDFFKMAQPSNTVFWVLIAVWGIIGLLLGALFFKLQKYGVVLLSMVAGVLGGHILTTAIQVHSEPVYWGIIIACALLAMFFSCWCQNNIRIVLTSLIGSFLFVRGIACYAGGFPNSEDMKFYTWKTFPKTFYAYFAGFIVLLAASIYFQRSQLKDVKQKKNEKHQKEQEEKHHSANAANAVNPVHVQTVVSYDLESSQHSQHQLNGLNQSERKPNKLS